MLRAPSTITLANNRTLADVLEAHARWLLGDRLWDDPDRANLDRANLDRANLVGANLDGANLVGANLVGARLVGARLDGANLDRANLDGANLDRANLDGANLVGANLVGANLDGANLDGANLVGANLVGANLDRANLDRANLDRANLDRANLDGANLDRANLVGANLESADLSRIAADMRALAGEYSTAEVLGLVRALYLGRVNGSCYSSACGMACLVGTIAIVKGVDVDELAQDSDRLAERWALSIRPGDAAPYSQVAELTARWLLSDLVERPDYDKAHPFGPIGGDARRSIDEVEAQGLEALAEARRLREAGT